MINLKFGNGCGRTKEPNLVRSQKEETMNLAFSTAIDLEQLAVDAQNSQQTVVNLVDREAELLARLEDLAARAETSRQEGTAALILEAEGLIEIQKGLKDQINRVQKRVEDLVSKTKADLLKEVEKTEDKKVETDAFDLKAIRNAPSCEITDEGAITKKYRREPLPIPSWKKWPVDKNKIASDLKQNRPVKGAKLKYTYRLDIKRK